MDFKIVDINKYHLTPESITHLIPNMTKIRKSGEFWYNDIIKKWCMSGSVADGYNSYWLGISLKDKKIELEFYSDFDMTGYKFKNSLIEKKWIINMTMNYKLHL